MTTTNRFIGTVLITGASSGIGAACARAFAAAGARLVLAARRAGRLEGLAQELRAAHGTETHLLTLDVRDLGVVTRALEDLPEDWVDVDVLVNNAGLARGTEPLHRGDARDWDEMIDTNIKGLLYVTRAVLPRMVERGRGHVINLGSFAGHEPYPGGAVYCGTKAAVSMISRGMRMDLFGTGVRVSSVDPGSVETDFSLVRYRGDAERAADVYRGYEPLTAGDVADAILYVATAPPHMNVHEVILTPTAQAAIRMIHREPD